VNKRSLPKLLALWAALLALPLSAAALEQKTLLASDGTLYTVRAGLASELSTSGYPLSSTDFVIQWSARNQNGGWYGGTIPGTTGGSVKKNLQLAFDETTGSLLLLWKEEVSVLNVLHLGILRGSEWKISDLLPNLGFPHAYNPQMVLTHQTVHYLDSGGHDATRVRPILSVLWWEEANSMQARYAPIFLDEDSSSSEVAVYEAPSGNDRRVRSAHGPGWFRVAHAASGRGQGPRNSLCLRGVSWPMRLMTAIPRRWRALQCARNAPASTKTPWTAATTPKPSAATPAGPFCGFAARTALRRTAKMRFGAPWPCCGREASRRSKALADTTWPAAPSTTPP
jgi:hypothetical protein